MTNLRCSSENNSRVSRRFQRQRRTLNLFSRPLLAHHPKLMTNNDTRKEAAKWTAPPAKDQHAVASVLAAVFEDSSSDEMTLGSNCSSSISNCDGETSDFTETSRSELEVAKDAPEEEFVPNPRAHAFRPSSYQRSFSPVPPFSREATETHVEEDLSHQRSWSPEPPFALGCLKNTGRKKRNKVPRWIPRRLSPKPFTTSTDEATEEPYLQTEEPPSSGSATSYLQAWVECQTWIETRMGSRPAPKSLFSQFPAEVH